MVVIPPQDGLQIAAILEGHLRHIVESFVQKRPLDASPVAEYLHSTACVRHEANTHAACWRKLIGHKSGVVIGRGGEVRVIYLRFLNAQCDIQTAVAEVRNRQR